MCYNTRLVVYCRLRNAMDDIAEAVTEEIVVKKRQFKEISRLSDFCFIDIRILFIVVSVYSSVANIISTTANNEATNDSQSDRPFNITTRPEHQNKVIRSVSNAVLWNCRELSVTNYYYQALYGMLVGAFFAIVLVFLVTRLTVMCGWRYRLSQGLHNILWQMAIVQRLREIVTEYGPQDNYTEQKAESYQDQWNDHKKISIPWTLKSIPYFEAVFLVVALPFIITSYDLSPLACLAGPDESSIEFDNETGRVTLDYPANLTNYQEVAVILAFVLTIPIALFAVMLYCNFSSVIKSMTAEIDNDDIPEPDDRSLSSDKNGNGTLSSAIDIINLVTNTAEDEIARRMLSEEIPIDELAETITSELSHVQ